MMVRVGLLLLWLGLFGIGTGVPATAQEIRIPALQGTALNGDPVVLPDALQGKVGVLVIGFSQASRDQVTGWGKRLEAGYRDSPSVLFYEMPVLASVPRLLRGWVTGRIRSTVPLRAQSRFVPIDSNEDAWKLAAHYNQPNDAYILLVDEHGIVRAAIQGAPTDTGYTDLRRHLEHLTPSDVDQRENPAKH